MAWLTSVVLTLAAGLAIGLVLMVIIVGIALFAIITEAPERRDEEHLGGH